MSHSALFTTEKKYERPILIVDKKGLIGRALCEKLKNESLVVFVSRENPGIEHENLVHIPFTKSFPTIPDNSYSHIILIDEGLEVSKRAIDSFLKKAKQDNSFIFIGVGRDDLTERFIFDATSNYEKVAVGVFGDIFAQAQVLDKSSYVNKFIFDVKTLGRITIPGDGMLEEYPVYLGDVVDKILEICFGKQEDKVYYLFPRFGVTLLTLASIFKRAKPDLRIDFEKKKIKQKDGHFFANGTYSFDGKYELEERIKKIDLSNIGSFSQPEGTSQTKTKAPLFLISFTFLVTLILLPVVSTASFFFIGQKLQMYLNNNISTGNTSTLNKISFLSLKSFEFSSDSFFLLDQEIGPFGFSQNLSKLNTDISTWKAAAKTYYYLTQSLNNLGPLLTGKWANSTSEFSNTILNLKNTIYYYNTEKDINPQDQLVDKSLADAMSVLSSTLDTWPDVFGFNGQKTYLVLFEDNSILRPSGGVINYYAVVNIDKGRITGANIYDTSSSDANLKASIEPPFPVRRYLSEDNWSLKESSFNVDFSKAAVASATLLNSEEQTVVDGVIGMDLYFVKDLLKISGPVTPVNSADIVNSDNFFSMLERNQPQGYLKDLLTALFTKLSKETNISPTQVLQLMVSSMYQKHLMFAFNNENQEAAFALNGFSSSIVDNRQQQDGTINDFTGISEANIGRNNINLYTTRAVSQRVMISTTGAVSESLTLTVKNNAGNNPDNFYQTYLNFILPSSSTLDSVYINEQDQKIVQAITDPSVYEAKNFSPPQGLEVYTRSQDGKDVIGFPVNIAPGQSSRVTLNYTLSQKLNLLQPEFSYSLKLFKQPGVDSYPYSFSFEIPDTYKITQASNQLINTSSSAGFSGEVDEDENLNISFSPK